MIDSIGMIKYQRMSGLMSLVITLCICVAGWAWSSTLLPRFCPCISYEKDVGVLTAFDVKTLGVGFVEAVLVG